MDHTLDLKTTHLQLGVLKITKRVVRRAPRRKQAGDAADAKDEQPAGKCAYRLHICWQIRSVVLEGMQRKRAVRHVDGRWQGCGLQVQLCMRRPACIFVLEQTSLAQHAMCADAEGVHWLRLDPHGQTLAQVNCCCVCAYTRPCSAGRQMFHCSHKTARFKL